mgnify:CR=1 FL=1|tara:strand:+ start:946 stop:1164 length:219 start_codon:yes stop_codon:yes gene_type:complete
MESGDGGFFLPYLGLFLRDITLAEEGNPAYIGNSTTMVNWERYEVICEALSVFRRYQEVLNGFLQFAQYFWT